MVSFRQEVERIIEEYGHYILLQRTDRKLRCRCFNEKFQEALSDCPYCFGSGWVSRIERHKVRGDSAIQTISRTNMGQQTEIGRMWVDAQTLYMKHDAHPKVGDMIYEVGWNGNRPVNLIRVYEINDAFANRGEGGRIEYWTTAIKSKTTTFDTKEILVRSIGPIKNYELRER